MLALPSFSQTSMELEIEVEMTCFVGTLMGFARCKLSRNGVGFPYGFQRFSGVSDRRWLNCVLFKYRVDRYL
jgi:hypothetical protein